MWLLILILALTAMYPVSPSRINVTRHRSECQRICIGIQKKALCLENNMRCNGKTNCKSGEDELYCCKNTSKCGIHDINIQCRSSSQSSASTLDFNLKFLDWENNPFSNIFKNNSILLLQCSLKGMYIDNNTENKISISDLQKRHIFTQFIGGPGIFRKVDYIKNLSLAGDISPLDKNTFKAFRSLVYLRISGTKIEYIGEFVFEKLFLLETLSLTQNQYLTKMHTNVFKGLRNLTELDISMNALRELNKTVFEELEFLNKIDLRGNSFGVKTFFSKNKHLAYISADSYSFCCVKPESVSIENCSTSKKDVVTSCNNLIQYTSLRVFLWVIGILAIVGNLAVIIHHFIRFNASKIETFAIFVLNLSFSDAMMGLYMITIGIHDSMFFGTYFSKSYEWRKSMLCKITGAISYVSNESSVIFILFITLDRFLGARYPVSKWRITPKRAYMISIIAWIVSFFTAALPGELYKGFYSRSGICIALPLTGKITEGRFYYSASVFLGFNFVAFSFIALGQYLIFREIRNSSKRVGRSLSSKEKSVAKLLLLIVVTDCLCWLPIGILVFLVIMGVTIPDIMYTLVAVFIMPVNSAINPFLYTFVPEIIKARREVRRLASIARRTGKTSIRTPNVRTQQLTS